MIKGKRINKNTVIIKVDVDLDKALGSAFRDEYLIKNPHGFSKVKNVHKNKKIYSRKSKNF